MPFLFPGCHHSDHSPSFSKVPGYSQSLGIILDSSHSLASLLNLVNSAITHGHLLLSVLTKHVPIQSLLIRFWPSPSTQNLRHLSLPKSKHHHLHEAESNPGPALYLMSWAPFSPLLQMKRVRCREVKSKVIQLVSSRAKTKIQECLAPKVLLFHGWMVGWLAGWTDGWING